MLHNRLRSATRILLAAALLLGLSPADVLAVPEESLVTAAAEQTVDVEVTQPTPSIAPDERLRLSVAVTTAAPAEYLEVRVRLRSPSGKLVYQKTEVRSDLPAGLHAIAYDYGVSSLDLAQGRYPIEVRVLATGADATLISSRLLVVDPDADALAVAVVVAPVDIPSITMSGALSSDPSADTSLRDDISFLTQLALARDEPLALALAPVLTEQLARVAGGYETTSGVEVAATDDQPTRYARMLETLRSAVATGTVELLDVPYGLPDNAGLAAIGGASDITHHWMYTDTVNALVFPSAPPATAAYLGRTLTPEGITSTEARGTEYVLAHGGSLRSDDATAAPGCYTLGDSDVTLIVVDEAAAAGIHNGPDAFYDALFDRLDSGPVVVLLETGPGAPNTTLDAQHALDWIGKASWLEATDVETLARACEPRKATLVRPGASDAPADYWAEVVESRSATLAYAGAVGPQDQEAGAAVRSLLTAESWLLTRSEAGDRGIREGSDRAAEAGDYALGQFALIRLDAKDVTLSGSKGDVPLTLINDTGKELALTLHAQSETMLSTVGSEEIVAQPTQNFLTLPVDLGNALSDELKVTVRAGGFTVAEASVGVKASYIDRLATVGMVVMVLGVLLVIIRRRVRAADAGTIVQDTGRSVRAPRKK
ncbi:MAG: hypothetical protein Q7W51_03360 [Coriobacteriia bacterium]|nr:hypothetical protein [Coriobacteriia bacterium]